MSDDSDFLKNLDKNEHPLKSIYPICLKIYGLFEKRGKAELFGSSDIIERLNINDNAEQAKKATACRTIANILAVLLISVILAVLMLIKGAQDEVLKDGRLSRANTGEGTIGYDLIAVNSETGETLDVTVSVSEQRCADDELDKFFDDAFEILQDMVLGEGVEADNVKGNLTLVDEIPGTSVRVSWPDLDYAYVFSDGTVRHEAISEPTIVSMTARLEYFDEVRIYSFPIRLMPAEKTEQSFREKLTAVLQKEDTDSGKTGWFSLPTQVDGVQVKWSEKKDNVCIWILILGSAAALAIVPGAKDELAKKDKARTEQMMRDYPELISKFVLLIGAGMTCRGAWEKICRDYINKRETAVSYTRRYAYEEMLRSQRELNLGMSEVRVYEEFGRRASVPAYRRLGTLLASNLRRGSREIINMLERESEEAFAERKAAVQMKAEEAGTKLLFPMLGMLCIVIAIVVVPAFTSFAG